MFDLGTDRWAIVARTVIVYVALLGGLRLAGTRELGQMTPFHLVVILLIANALQNAMVRPDASAVLEVDGTISIVPSTSEVVRTTRRIRQRKRQG